MMKADIPKSLENFVKIQLVLDPVVKLVRNTKDCRIENKNDNNNDHDRIINLLFELSSFKITVAL